MFHDLFWSTPTAKLGTLALAAALVVIAVYVVRLLAWLVRRVIAVEPVFDDDDAVTALRRHEPDPRLVVMMAADYSTTATLTQTPRALPARRLAIDALVPPMRVDTITTLVQPPSRPLAPPRLGMVHSDTLAQAAVAPATVAALRERQTALHLAPWRDVAAGRPAIITTIVEPARPAAAVARRRLRERLFGEQHDGASLTSESPKTADHKATPTFTPTDLLTGDKSVTLEPYGVIGATDAPTYKMVAKDVHESPTAFAQTSDAIATFGANIDNLLADFLGISVKAVHATVTCAHDRTQEIDGDAIAALLAIPTGELVNA